MSFNGQKLYDDFMKDNADLFKNLASNTTELTPELLDEVYYYSSLGMYERQVAMMIGVSDKTLFRMKERWSCVKDALKLGYKAYGSKLFEKKHGKIDNGSLNMLNHGLQRFDRLKNPYNSKEENKEAQDELDNEFYSREDCPVKK